MTEKEWMESTDAAPMLAFLRGRVSKRKLRLLACACCRRIWHLLSDEPARRAVEVAERYVDGLVGDSDWSDVYYSLSKLCATTEGNPAENVAAQAVLAVTTQFLSPGFDRLITQGIFNAMRAGAGAFSPVTGEFDPSDDCSKRMASEKADQAVVLRDIFANPFRPVTLDPSWLTRTVTALAHAIYSDRNFTDLPILADALEEAGCTNPDILVHCRSPGPHVLGCWALDLLLGKS
jgi:hypothetical protein